MQEYEEGESWQHVKPDSLVPEGMDVSEKKAWQQRLELYMDTGFAMETRELDWALQRGDPDGFWVKWSRIVEEAFIKARGAQGVEADKLRGHGKVRFHRKTRTAHLETLAQRDRPEGEKGAQVGVPCQQLVWARKLRHMADRLRPQLACVKVQWDRELACLRNNS